MTATPFADRQPKTRQVALMFDGIAARYDALNRVISLGLDQRWRRDAIAALAVTRPRRILDIATGAGELVFAMDRVLAPELIVGVDVSEQMLARARSKARDLPALRAQIEFHEANAAQLPFESGSFDTVTVAFGVRNFEHVDAALAEMVRVLAPGGSCVILEFSMPQTPLAAIGYTLATRALIPLTGRALSRDPAAYDYLPQSIDAFPDREQFAALMLAAGCEHVATKLLRPGVCTVYVGTKR